MADEIPASGPPRLEPISVVWHTFAAPETLLILLAVLALTLAATGLIPQTSIDGLRESDAWLAVERGPLSRYADLVRSAGLLDLYHSFWFRLFLALTGLALLVRGVDAAELAWRARKRDEWELLAALPWQRRAQHVAVRVPAALDEVRERSMALLGEKGYGWTEVEESGKAEFVAAYRPGRLWLRAALYGALLVAGAGLAVALTLGWQGDVWEPVPLEIQAVGHNTAYAVRLDAFDLRFNAQGQLADYRSRVTWLQDGAELQPDVATVGHPARVNGVVLRQIAYAPVVRLRAQARDGRTLLLQVPGQPAQGRDVVTVRFGSADDQPLVFVPQFERFFTLVFEPACAGSMPAVQIYQIEQAGEQREKVATLHDSGEVALGDVQLDVDLTYVPVLRLDYHPGMSVVFAALGAALIALIALWLFPARLLHVCAIAQSDSRTSVEIKVLAGPRQVHHLRALGSHLDEVKGRDA
jgi:hypothetical protein